MQVTFTKQIGDTVFTFTQECAMPADFFRFASFYANIPTVGPGQETDLQVTYRTTKQGHKYYSIVSEKAGQEFCFGQYLDCPDALFPKDWANLWKKEDAEGAAPTPAATQAPAATAQAATAPPAAPAATAAAAPQSAESKAVVNKYV